MERLKSVETLEEQRAALADGRAAFVKMQEEMLPHLKVTALLACETYACSFYSGVGAGCLFQSKSHPFTRFRLLGSTRCSFSLSTCPFVPLYLFPCSFVPHAAFIGCNPHT